ncbi:MAG: Fe(2+)-trafficking protein [Tepidisphaeraceae bacterium]
MSETDLRIEQFRKMANDDPDNELGHFSLGRALFEAGRFDEAIASLSRVLELNPNIGKAYQLLAGAQLRAEKKDQAIATLKTGAKVAHERGDFMPKNEMLKTLREFGIEMPELKGPQKAVEVGEGQIQCNRCGRVMPKMPHAPFSNAQGKLIHEKICGECWREWIGMGTKVINELRLPLHDPQAQRTFDQHMMEFLNLS